MTLMIVLFAFLALIQLGACKVFKFPEEGTQITQSLEGGYFHYAQPMYASDSDAANAFIAFNIEFNRVTDSDKLSPSTVEVLVLESAVHGHDVGFKDSASSMICCTKERMNQNIPGCNVPNTLIVNSNPDSVWRKTVQLPAGQEENVQFHELYEISSSGFHQVVISKCSPSDDVFSVVGDFEFKNSYGYLPGQLYAYLPFYTSMSFIYAIVCTGWIGWNVKQSAELIPIHHVITATALVSLVNMIAWGFHYEVFNMFGVEQEAWKYLAIGLGALRQTAFHVLMLCISSGLGIVNLEMGSEKMQIIFLSVLFCLFKAIFDFTSDASKSPDSLSVWVATVPFFLVESYIYWKVYKFTSGLMERLEERQQINKFSLYNKIVTLFILGMFSVSLILLQRAYLMHYGLLQSNWKMFWLVDSGLFEMLTCVVLLGVMMVFRPTSRSKMLIMSNQLPLEEEYGLEMGTNGFEEDEDDEEDLLNQDNSVY